jgi:hypothetical protein
MRQQAEGEFKGKPTGCRPGHRTYISNQQRANRGQGMNHGETHGLYGQAGHTLATGDEPATRRGRHHGEMHKLYDQAIGHTLATGEDPATRRGRHHGETHSLYDQAPGTS